MGSQSPEWKECTGVLGYPPKYQSQKPPRCRLGSLVQTVPQESEINLKEARREGGHVLRMYTMPGSHPCSSTSHLHHLGQVSMPLCASIFSSIK